MALNFSLDLFMVQENQIQPVGAATLSYDPATGAGVFASPAISASIAFNGSASQTAAGATVSATVMPVPTPDDPLGTGPGIGITFTYIRDDDERATIVSGVLIVYGHPFNTVSILQGFSSDG